MNQATKTIIVATVTLSLKLITTEAAEIPRNNYLKYVPLEYPKLIHETNANKEFKLYGDERLPSYSDRNPRDGIDDERGRFFTKLARYFTPRIILNTSNFPMDFEKVQRIQNKARIYIDYWEVSGPTPVLTSTKEINLEKITTAPCTDKRSPDNDDCRLLELLEAFDPTEPKNPWLKTPTVGPRSAPFSVPFIDFIGDSPETWNKEYTDPNTGGIPEKYKGTQKTYVHPLINEHTPSADNTKTFDFVLQYWFFYPQNDAANKHKGDWEHINILITPKSKVGQGLTVSEIIAILNTDLNTKANDPLVISRVDYYFHAYVMSLDLSKPNAYLSKKEWQAELDKIPEQKIGQAKIAEAIRRMAWTDETETEINTHPNAYIGADSKGAELLLFPPGPKNRDGHGTYPFPGLYKNIGPVAAAEEISNNDPKPSEILILNQEHEIELIPDWERIIDATRNDAWMRRKWYWLLLPLRWGYPAVESPFAGIISHAETGNIASLAPPFNVAWNRPGTTTGTASYAPDRYPGIFPLSPIDSLQNNWGWFNAIGVPLTTLPPLNMAYKLVFSPIKSASDGEKSAIYFPTNNPPLRTLSLAVGMGLQSMDDNAWNVLFLNTKQFNQLVSGIDSIDPAHGEARDIFTNGSIVPEYQIQFHLGSNFSTQNTLRHVFNPTGFDITKADSNAPPIQIRGDIERWELAGDVRYNIMTDWIQPFVKLGYGWSWYKLKNVSLNGAYITPQDSDWVEQPGLFPLRNILPNEWTLGGGLELIPINQHGEFLNGLDYGIKLEISYTTQTVDVDFAAPLELGLPPPSPSTSRLGISLIGVISL